MKVSIVLETSAIISILLGDQDSQELFDQAQLSHTVYCPTNCVIEAVVVLTRKTDAGAAKAKSDVLALLTALNVIYLSLDTIAMHHALDGHIKYGKGTGKQPAVLNFGDCLSYGAAKAASGQLIYTGGDFAQTDLV
jgi:ribonuclease VapC